MPSLVPDWGPPTLLSPSSSSFFLTLGADKGAALAPAAQGCSVDRLPEDQVYSPGRARVGAVVLHKDPDSLQRAGHLGPAWVGSCRHRVGRGSSGSEVFLGTG